MPVTDWLTAPPPAELSHPISSPFDSVGPPNITASHVQWGPAVDAQGFPLPSGLEIDYAESDARLEEFYRQPVGSGGSDFAGVSYNNQWAISSPVVYSDVFTEGYSMNGTVIPVIDSDGWDYRASQSGALGEAFKAANPGVAVVYGFEWEGSSDPTQPLGTHSNRHLIVRYMGLNATMDRFVTPPGGGLTIREPEDPNVIPSFRILLTVLGSANSSGTYISQDNAEFTGPLDFWTAGTAPKIGQINRAPNQGGLEDYNFPVDDSYFDQLSIPLTKQFETYKHTRGMRVVAVPIVQDVRRAENAYDGTSMVTNIWYVTTYQPPRYRLTYSIPFIPVDDRPTHLRVFPRDDSLAGGAQRTYPPSRAVQTSNRTGGGYL